MIEHDELLAKLEALAQQWEASAEVFPRSAAGVFAKSHANQLREAMAVGDEGMAALIEGMENK